MKRKNPYTKVNVKYKIQISHASSIPLPGTQNTIMHCYFAIPMEHEKDKTITADGDAVKASPRQHVALGELTKKTKTKKPLAHVLI